MEKVNNVVTEEAASKQPEKQVRSELVVAKDEKPEEKEEPLPAQIVAMLPKVKSLKTNTIKNKHEKNIFVKTFLQCVLHDVTDAIMSGRRRQFFYYREGLCLYCFGWLRTEVRGYFQWQYNA
jgi:hypothetical protein